MKIHKAFTFDPHFSYVGFEIVGLEKRLWNQKREMSRELESALETLKSQLGDALIVAVLFGSRARGKRGKTSDWDLLETGALIGAVFMDSEAYGIARELVG